MPVSIDDVRYVAALARLKLTAEEEVLMTDHLSSILEYMEKLNELDTTGVPPMSHVLDIVNADRPDEVVKRITHEEALKNAPDADSDYFRVPKVVE